MRKSFLRVRSVTYDQKLNHADEQKTHSTKSEKWSHARISVEIAWTNEQKADLKWLRRHIVVKNNDQGKKNQEKANNSPSYRCGAIN